MAKMRVYELAKDLKMDSKELVRRLIEMDLDVRNHMSMVTSEQAEMVRKKLAESRAEVVEEKRVTSRVIRRRRRKVKPKPEPLAEVQPGAPAEAAEAQPAQVPEKEAEPAAGTAEARAGTPAEAAEAQPAQVPEKEAEPAAETAEAQAGTPGEAAEVQPQAPAGEAEAQPARVPGQEAEKKPAGPEPVKPKKTKRSIYDEPARIISRPTTPVPPMTTGRPAPGGPRRPSGPPRGGRPGAVPPAAVPPPGKEDRGRGRRKKGKKGGAIPDDDFLMRKTRSRRREILDKADLYDGRSRRGRKRSAGSKKLKKTEVTTPKAIKRRIKVGEAITVGELAKRMGIKAAEMVGRLMQSGMMVTVNQALDVEEAILVASEFGFEVERVGFEEENLLERRQDRPEDLKPRPPVVTIMGHVDHGKTSLLDKIRSSDVVSGEAGGITQHIGAYLVNLESGEQVVFVDTPGHEAFTQMRARGAKVTDIVVLVVAADDGVMDQTREAINHSKAAGVPIMVAVNKIDKPGADPQRVRRELSEMGLVAEDWGGDVIMVDVSAKTGQGISELLEMLILQAELLELKANPDKPARGYNLEARLDKGRGPVATVLVQEGTLNTGDAFVCGVHAGKVRAMFDDRGRRVKSAGPSIPVEVQGLSGVPEAGDEFVVVESEKVARQIAEHRATKKREAELSAQKAVSLESFFEKAAEQDLRELTLVVKADVQGSVEALVEALGKLGNDKVRVNVIHAATGAITETDVMLAAASEAIILGFNVRPMSKVMETAESMRVDIRTYDVIYQLLDDVTAALAGLLEPVLEEEVIGRLEVRDTFNVPKVGTIAGCYVVSGKAERNANARLLRDGVVVTTTKVASLRRFKDDVKEVAQGFECGLGLENYNDIKVGDEVELFRTIEVAAQL